MMQEKQAGSRSLYCCLFRGLAITLIALLFCVPRVTPRFWRYSTLIGSSPHSGLRGSSVRGNSFPTRTSPPPGQLSSAAEHARIEQLLGSTPHPRSSAARRKTPPPPDAKNALQTRTATGYTLSSERAPFSWHLLPFDNAVMPEMTAFFYFKSNLLLNLREKYGLGALTESWREARA
jgi:hypothetical protein